MHIVHLRSASSHGDRGSLSVVKYALPVHDVAGRRVLKSLSSTAPLVHPQQLLQLTPTSYTHDNFPIISRFEGGLVLVSFMTSVTPVMVV